MSIKAEVVAEAAIVAVMFCVADRESDDFDTKALVEKVFAVCVAVELGLAVGVVEGVAPEPTVALADVVEAVIPDFGPRSP